VVMAEVLKVVVSVLAVIQSNALNVQTAIGQIRTDTHFLRSLIPIKLKYWLSAGANPGATGLGSAVVWGGLVRIIFLLI